MSALTVKRYSNHELAELANNLNHRLPSAKADIALERRWIVTEMKRQLGDPKDRWKAGCVHGMTCGMMAKGFPLEQTNKPLTTTDKCALVGCVLFNLLDLYSIPLCCAVSAYSCPESFPSKLKDDLMEDVTHYVVAPERQFMHK